MHEFRRSPTDPVLNHKRRIIVEQAAPASGPGCEQTLRPNGDGAGRCGGDPAGPSADDAVIIPLPNSPTRNNDLSQWFQI